MIVKTLNRKEILEAVIRGMKNEFPKDSDGYLTSVFTSNAPEIEVIYWRKSEQN